MWPGAGRVGGLLGFRPKFWLGQARFWLGSEVTTNILVETLSFFGTLRCDRFHLPWSSQCLSGMVDLTTGRRQAPACGPDFCIL